MTVRPSVLQSLSSLDTLLAMNHLFSRRRVPSLTALYNVCGKLHSKANLAMFILLRLLTVAVTAFQFQLWLL